MKNSKYLLFIAIVVAIVTSCSKKDDQQQFAAHEQAAKYNQQWTNEFSNVRFMLGEGFYTKINGTPNYNAKVIPACILLNLIFKTDKANAGTINLYSKTTCSDLSSFNYNGDTTRISDVTSLSFVEINSGQDVGVNFLNLFKYPLSSSITPHELVYKLESYQYTNTDGHPKINLTISYVQDGTTYFLDLFVDQSIHG